MMSFRGADRWICLTFVPLAIYFTLLLLFMLVLILSYGVLAVALYLIYRHESGIDLII